MNTLRRVCVNCGSNPGRLPEYAAGATALGRHLAEQGIEVVFGGADLGLMGAVADAALAAGGKVTGIIPQAIADKVGYHGRAEMRVVGSMHERKQRFVRQEHRDMLVVAATPEALLESLQQGRVPVLDKWLDRRG